MAEIVLSVLLPVVFEKLASEALNKFAARSKKIHSELEKWNTSLLQIQNLLSDAAQKEITNKSVKDWLNRLQHLAYDMDDELDALATDAAMHREEASRNITSKVKNLIPTFSSSSSSTTRMHYSKLNDITIKLKELYDEKDNLGLTVKDERSSQDINRSYQTSLLSPDRIVGRDSDKKILLEKLLADHEPTGNQYNFSIVPIVGMGGIGKTTLARLLYNEPKVNQHFDLKVWVCVSDEFDSINISKLIYESVAEEEKEDKEEKEEKKDKKEKKEKKEKDFKNPNLLQEALRNKLAGKRLLLVLDDVWSEKIEDWKTLVPPFHAVAPGSKIIITTRKKQLLQQLGYDNPYHLNKLSHDDALSLFAQYALGENNFDSSPTLKPHGEGIVQKCDGLPLALQALGSLLRTKTSEEKWKELLESDIWSLKDGGGILPALRLSYLDLSACLKQLFAYSCLFPKDYVFDKEDLILLWMAEGFLLESSTSKSMECLGEEYFDELLSRSFFQHVPNDESLFMMHDLMNDLATFVAGEFFIMLDIGMKNKIEEKKYRHMSFVREEFMSLEKFKVFEQGNTLRTFLAVPVVVRDGGREEFYPSHKILDHLLPGLPLLRSLCLSKLQIHEIPESIGDLKHLRYLNLSETPITHIPDNVCNLYNLQTLIVFGCHNLRELPYSFLKLKKLRHFDIRDTPLLKSMPLGVGVLKSLQTLSKISIGGENEFPISGLKNLKNIRRRVCIDGLDKLQNNDLAREANLSQMRLSELVVEWGNVFNGSRNQSLETEVLDVLKPHSDNLKNLEVVSYGGTKFPKWVGDSSFGKLAVVCMYRCRNCVFLPALGQLPSLKKLSIESMNGVKKVGLELLGTGSVTFPSLEILRFYDMPQWEVWSVNAVGVAVFPCLKELYIGVCPKMARWEVSSANADVRVFPRLEKLVVRRCPNLVEVSLEAVPSLRELILRGCSDGVLKSLVGIASSVTQLSVESISGLTEEVWGGVVQSLRAVEDLTIRGCKEIRNLWESEEAEACKTVLVNLKRLYVGECEELVSIGGRGGEKEEEEKGSNLPTSLRMLEIWECKNLKHLSCPDSIETLRIGYCEELVSIGGGGGDKEEVEKGSNLPTSLRFLKIGSCKNLKHLSCPDSIETLDIGACENLEHLSCPANSIQELRIWGCRSITCVSFPTEEGGGGWQKLKSLHVGSCNPVLEKELEKQVSVNNTMPILEELRISYWEDHLKSITKFTTCFIQQQQQLIKLEIVGCQGIESFPDLQDLVSLKHLQIFSCLRMDSPPPLPLTRSGGGVWPPKLDFLEIGGLKRPISEWGPLPTSLVQLTLRGGYGSWSPSAAEKEDVKSFPTSSLLPYSLSSSLTRLQLLGFEKMERISKGLQHLTSLQHLSIMLCPKLKDLPETLLPSLLSLTIRDDCNGKLKKKTMSRRGSYWPFLSHIPKVDIS